MKAKIEMNTDASMERSKRLNMAVNTEQDHKNY